MTIKECYQYTTDALNNLGTNRKDNVPKHVFVRAFNAAQDIWVEERVKLLDTNRTRIDELQSLIKSVSNSDSPLVYNNGILSMNLPSDYYHFYRPELYAPCLITLFPKKPSEISLFRNDENWKPSIEWAESIFTIEENKLKIYWDFDYDSVEFYYIKTPRKVNMQDGFSVDGVLNEDIDPELTNSSVLEILQKTIAFLSGSVQDQFNYQINKSEDSRIL